MTTAKKAAKRPNRRLENLKEALKKIEEVTEILQDLKSDADDCVGNTVGEGPVSHVVLNNLVCVAGQAGIFTFDGAKAQRLTLDTPAAPLALAGEGSLTEGTYGVAVAWLRGALESAPSAIKSVAVPDNGSLEITLPLCLDASVTGVRLYLTQPNGGELAREQDYPLASPTILVRVPPKLGAPAQFRHLSPMPTGLYLAYWRGRLL